MNCSQKSPNKQFQTLRSKSCQSKETSASQDPDSKSASPYRLRDFHIVLQRLPPESINLKDYEDNLSKLKFRNSLECNNFHRSEMEAQPSLCASNKSFPRSIKSRNTALISTTNNNTISKRQAFKNTLCQNANSLPNVFGKETSVINVCHKSQKLENTSKTSVNLSGDKEPVLPKDGSHNSKGINNGNPSQSLSSFTVSRNPFRKHNGQCSISEQKETSMQQLPNPNKRRNPTSESFITITAKKVPSSLIEKEKTISNVDHIEGSDLSLEISNNDARKKKRNKSSVPLMEHSDVSQKAFSRSLLHSRRKGNPKRNISNSKKRKNNSSILKPLDSHLTQNVLESNMALPACNTSSKNIKNDKPNVTIFKKRKASKQRTTLFSLSLKEGSSSKAKIPSPQADNTFTNIPNTSTKNKKSSSSSTITETNVSFKSTCKQQNEECGNSNSSDVTNCTNAVDYCKNSFPTFFQSNEISKQKRGRKTAQKRRKQRMDPLVGNGKFVKSSKPPPVSENKVMNNHLSTLRSSTDTDIRTDHSPAPLVKERNVYQALSKKGKKPRGNSVGVHSLHLPFPQTKHPENKSVRSEQESHISEKNIRNKNFITLIKKGDICKAKYIPKRGKKTSTESASTYEMLNSPQIKRSKTIVINSKSDAQLSSIECYSSESKNLKINKRSGPVVKTKMPFKKRIVTRNQQKERKCNGTSNSELHSTQLSIESNSALTTIDSSKFQAEMQGTTCCNSNNDELLNNDEQLEQSTKDLRVSDNEMDEDKSVPPDQTSSLDKTLDAFLNHTKKINRKAVNLLIDEQKPGIIDGSDISKDSNGFGMINAKSNHISLLNNSENESESSLEHEITLTKNVNCLVLKENYRKRRLLVKEITEEYPTKEPSKIESELSSLKDKTALKFEFPVSDSGEVFENNRDHQNIHDTTIDPSTSEYNLKPSTSTTTNFKPSNDYNFDTTNSKTCSVFHEPFEIVSDITPSLNKETTTLNTIQEAKPCDLENDISSSSINSPKQSDHNQFSCSQFQNTSYCMSLKSLGSMNDASQVTLKEDLNTLSSTSPNCLHNYEVVNTSPKIVNIRKKDPSLSFNESTKCLESEELTLNGTVDEVEDLQNEKKSVNGTHPSSQTSLDKDEVQDEDNTNQKTLQEEGSDVSSVVIVSQNSDTISNSSFKNENILTKEEFSSLARESTNVSSTFVESKETKWKEPTSNVEDSQDKTISVSSSMRYKCPLPDVHTHLNEEKEQREGDREKIRAEQGSDKASDTFVPYNYYPVNNSASKMEDLHGKELSSQLNVSTSLLASKVESNETEISETISEVEVVQNKNISATASKDSDSPAFGVQHILNVDSLSVESEQCKTDQSETINLPKEEQSSSTLTISTNLLPSNMETATNAPKIFVDDSHNKIISVNTSNRSSFSIPTKPVNLNEGSSLSGECNQISRNTSKTTNLQKEEESLLLSISTNLLSLEIESNKEKAASETVVQAKTSENKVTSVNASKESSFSFPAVQVNLDENNHSCEGEQIKNDQSKMINVQKTEKSSLTLNVFSNLLNSKIKSKNTAVSGAIKLEDSQSIQTPVNSSKGSILQVPTDHVNLIEDELCVENNDNTNTLPEETTVITPCGFDLLVIISNALKSDKLALMPASKANVARYLLKQLTLKQSETEEYEVNLKYHLDISNKLGKPKAIARPDFNLDLSFPEEMKPGKMLSEKLPSKPKNVPDNAVTISDKKIAEDHAFKVPNKVPPRAKKKSLHCSESNTFLKPKPNESNVQRITPNINEQTKCTKCYLSGTIPRNMCTGLIVCYSHKTVRKMSFPTKLNAKQTPHKNLPASFLNSLKEKTPAIKERITSEVGLSYKFSDSHCPGDKKPQDLYCKEPQISAFDENTTSNYYALNKASIAAHEDHRYFRTPPCTSNFTPIANRKESDECKTQTEQEIKEDKIPCKLSLLEHKYPVTSEKKIGTICSINKCITISDGSYSEFHIEINQRSQKSEGICNCVINNPVTSKKLCEAVLTKFAVNRRESEGNLPKVSSHPGDGSSRQKNIPYKEGTHHVNKSENIISKEDISSNESTLRDIKQITNDKLKAAEQNITLNSSQPNSFMQKELNNHLHKEVESPSFNHYCEAPHDNELHSFKHRSHLNESRTRNINDNTIQSQIADNTTLKQEGNSCCLESVLQGIPKSEIKITSDMKGNKRHLSDPSVVERPSFPATKRPKENESLSHNHCGKKVVPNELSNLRGSNPKESKPPEEVCQDKSSTHKLHISQNIDPEINSTSLTVTNPELPKKISSTSADSFSLDNNKIAKEAFSDNSSSRKRSYPMCDEQNKCASKKMRNNDNLTSNGTTDTFLQNHSSDSKQNQNIDCSNIKLGRPFTSNQSVCIDKGLNADSAICNALKSRDTFLQRSENLPLLSEKKSSLLAGKNAVLGNNSALKTEKKAAFNTSDTGCITVLDPPPPTSQETSNRSDLAVQICEFVTELRKLDNTTVDALNNYKKGINNDKVNQELKSMIPREGLSRKTHPDRPPEWFLKFIANFRKQELWRLHQMFKIHDHLMRIESAKLNVLEKVYEELKGNERLNSERV